MCGRYSIAAERQDLEERFGATFSDSSLALTRRYNAAPSQALPVILNREPSHIRLLPWGIHPPWFKRSRSDGLINVRMETLRDKPTFKADLAERRCLVLADGFYEWQKTPGGKVPYRFVVGDGEPFAFAGIWEESLGGAGPRLSFAIVTAPADAVVAPVHNRMPVILPKDVEREWISPSRSPAEALSVLADASRVALRAYPVSSLVNRASVDSPELIEPVGDRERGQRELWDR